MPMQWLTILAAKDGTYLAGPRPADNYDEAIRRALGVVERHNLRAPQLDSDGRVSFDTPRYMPHVLLDLTASSVDDVEFVELVTRVPLIAAIFEAGRQVGHREAAGREA